MKHIVHPTVIPSAGTKPKIIEEFVGRVNTKTKRLSIARMKSPEGWVEPAQTPEFDEYTIVLSGALQIETNDEKVIVRANEAYIATAGATVKYSTPEPGGAEYIAVCQPAFSIDTVHRDE